MSKSHNPSGDQQAQQWSPGEGIEWPAWLGGGIGEALVHIPSPAYILDRKGLIRWENARAIEIFGDHRNSHFTTLVAREFLPRARLEFAKKVMGSARTSNYESVLRTRAGGHVRAEIRAVALRDGDHVVGVFGIVDLAVNAEDQPQSAGELTPRQHEVLRSLARGCSTAQIAESLGVTRETVRNHLRGLFRALRVHSRVAAIAEARSRGLID